MHYILEQSDLDRIISLLKQQGYETLGPLIRDGAIVYDQVNSTKDFPIGWTDEQEAGSYRLKKRADKALFAFVVGPHSWKQFLFPAEEKLWSSRKKNGKLVLIAEPLPQKKHAFIGVRACELHAITIQDKVFIGSQYQDKAYKSRREGVFILAVNCSEAHATCFCDSMGTGPKVDAGYDLALTEMIDSTSHSFLVHVGSERGTALLETLSLREASKNELEAAQKITAITRSQMGRKLETQGIKELLYDNMEHTRWDEVADRCLSCANCTMVCPTCFCSSAEDVSDLSTNEESTRVRKWDSCFSADFSYIHGGNVRQTLKSRYRQWLTHKLASWIDQFGSSGCVGCGRCISWCPVGIDITEEIAAIRKQPLESAKKRKDMEEKHENN